MENKVEVNWAWRIAFKLINDDGLFALFDKRTMSRDGIFLCTKNTFQDKDSSFECGKEKQQWISLNCVNGI
jgi:hypothetical protein